MQSVQRGTYQILLAQWTCCCFSHLEEGLEKPSIHYFNNFYFLGVHPNLTSIACCGTHQRVEEVIM
jgi:hypothetical protein